MDTGKEILEGFNAGYLIEKHRPGLNKQLVNAVEGVDMPFIEGYVAGSNECAKERTRSKNISRIVKASKSIKPKQDKGRDDKGFEINK